MKPIDQFDLEKCLRTPKFDGLAAISVDANGEPVFQAPWQTQIFAVVIFLTEKGVLSLEDFRLRLHIEIESATKYVTDSQAYLAANYYQLWLVTLEALLVEKGFCLQEKLVTEQADRLLASVGSALNVLV